MSTPALLHHFPRYFYSGIAQRDRNSIPAPLIWSDSLCDVLKMFAQQWFSHARVTRARFPGLVHFLLSLPSQTNEKSRLFSPKTKTKNALSFRFSSSLGTAPKMSHISTKTWEILTKTSEFFEETWEKFSKMSELFLKHSEILQTQPGHFFHSAPKIERKNPFPLKLPSFHLLFSSQAEKIRQSFCPQITRFQPSISSFPPAFP